MGAPAGKLCAVEFSDAVRQRAMVRSFAPDPVDLDVVERLLRAALRAPTAGNTGGTAWVALSGAETAAYWDATTDEAWRAGSPRWEGMRRAPVVLLAYASAAAYVARYGEADKAGSSPGLSADETNWTVPYWTGDAAFGVMTVLLGAVAEGLGACILGNFRGEERLAGVLGVPNEWRLFCAVVVGRPDGGDHRSASLDRPVPGAGERIHWGGW
jgi:nitroreductase